MISVIIPVYNTKQYLKSCLNSVLAQTYSNLEILFIDDGSTDGSGALLDSFAETDPRIRVIHQANGGVCAARNRGIEEAAGEWLSFIDSDDTLEPDLYQTLMALIRQYGGDIAHCSYHRITDGVVKPIGGTGSIHVHTPEQALECLLTGKLFVGSCWTKLYRRELFREVRFPRGIRTNEDMLVNFQVFSRARKAVFADMCKYNYLTSETSSCIRTPQRKRAEDLLTVNRRMLAENVFPELMPILEKRVLNALFSCYRASIYESEPDRAFLRELTEQIRQMNRRGLRFSRRTELEYLLLRSLPGVYKFAYGIYDRIRVPNYDV
jgi:glycosyltransferase involved in cell wall biosynthesis